MELNRRADAWFASEGIALGDRQVVRSVDLRYGGQGFELNVECSPGALDEAAIASLRAGFERVHRLTYGYVSENEPIHLTTLRLEAVGRVPKARLAKYPAAATTSATPSRHGASLAAGSWGGRRLPTL